MDFIIDTVGDNLMDGEKQIDIATDQSKQSTIADLKRFRDQLLQNSSNSVKTVRSQKINFNDKLTSAILKDLNWSDKKKPRSKNETSGEAQKILDNLKSTKNNLEIKKILEKSIITQDIEKLHALASVEVSKRKLQQERREEKSKTKGKKWFNLPATEMTEEVKRDLEILQMRSVLDPKHFYKKNDLKVLPKYFQIGKVVDSPLDFYSNRLIKKDRKKTLVDELLADAEFQKYNKRKYKEIIEEKQKTHYKAWRQAKRLKKKK